MTSKLDTMKAVLADYDAIFNENRAAFDKYVEYAQANNIIGETVILDDEARQRELDALEKLTAFAPDYLRTLIAVAAAAAEIREPTVVIDGQTKMECACCGNIIHAVSTDQHAEDCPWLILQKALELLD